MKKVIIITLVVIVITLVGGGVFTLSKLRERKAAMVELQNTSSVKSLWGAMIAGKDIKQISDIPGYQNLRFSSSHGEEDWLFSPNGFGILEDGRKVLFLSPRAVNGNLVAAGHRGSAFVVSVEDAKKSLDLSQVKL
ncbi:hypothetical protein [Persicirhabdus sediminis]|uniref:Uncharacterized protein n=1 Tax=Persicirhabdus sediminis TaxID=454144 RepID=A0A8J7MEW9_9BACT|nr:hypothetical protein [Persicirhabdus sediminis]MBK1791408.1 hypothetical protein [Persicirhabdus sediminis]